MEDDQDRVVDYLGGRLLLSSFQGSKEKNVVEEYNVTHVLSVARGIPINHFCGVEYYLIEVDDWYGEDLLSHLGQCVDYIEYGMDDCNGNVLVHCSAGVSRSPTVIVAFLMKDQNLNVFDCMDLVKKAKPNVKIRENFIRQLLLWQKWNFSIVDNQEEYILYRLESIYKSNLLNVISTTSKNRNQMKELGCCGIEPNNFLTQETFQQLHTLFNQETPENESETLPSGKINLNALSEFQVYCCKQCKKQLFTLLNLIKKHEDVLEVERMTWMNLNSNCSNKKLTDYNNRDNNKNRILCFECGTVIGEFEVLKSESHCFPWSKIYRIEVSSVVLSMLTMKEK